MERGIDADALHRARALREAFAARHGVLTLDLVEAARTDRQGQQDPPPDRAGEG